MQSISETSVKDWEFFTRLNGDSVFYTCKFALPFMRNGGSIIITSSLVGMIGQPNSAAYVYAKAGIIGLAKGMAIDLAPRGITVNAIAPGDVNTPLYDKWFKDHPEGTPKAEIENKIPLKRFAEPSEIADAVVLLSKSYITGQVIPIDGGKSLGTY